MSNNNPGCLGIFLKLFGIAPQLPNKQTKLPYGVRDDFLSPAELSFYNVLRNCVGNQAVICPKVSVSDILFVNIRDRSSHTSYLNKINRKHVDFLLCHPITMEPICAIELDDTSHSRPDRVVRDQFINQAFRDAGLHLIRYKNQNSYSLTEIEGKLLPILRGDIHSIKQPDASKELVEQKLVDIPRCNKCGTPMVERTATRGPRKGQTFYGCSNYPKCKAKIET